MLGCNLSEQELAAVVVMAVDRIGLDIPAMAGLERFGRFRAEQL